MSEQKGYCEDLTEGKFSFPVSHAMWINDSSKGEILRILKSKTTDDMVKAYVVDCLEKSGSLEYTRVALEGLYERARALLVEIPQPNPAIEALVEKLVAGIRSSA
jgi:geranylgeranyl diphosphate synthase type 3